MAVHPLASVTVTEKVPELKFCGSSIVEPFDHEYVYGLVPPLTLKLIDPVLFPLQSTFTWVVLRDNAVSG